MAACRDLNLIHDSRSKWAAPKMDSKRTHKTHIRIIITLLFQQQHHDSTTTETRGATKRLCYVSTSRFGDRRGRTIGFAISPSQSSPRSARGTVDDPMWRRPLLCGGTSRNGCFAQKLVRVREMHSRRFGGKGTSPVLDVATVVFDNAMDLGQGAAAASNCSGWCATHAVALVATIYQCAYFVLLSFSGPVVDAIQSQKFQITRLVSWLVELDGRFHNALCGYDLCQ